ncbi:MAG: hypothetical protein ACI93L_002391 [Cyclobacteriaceae bacterium]|jgi:hypothetical protein
MKKLSSQKYLQLILTFSMIFLLCFVTIGQTSFYNDAVSSGTIWHSNGAEIANPLNNSENSSSTVIANAGAGGWEETQVFPDTYTINSGDKLYISFYNPNGASGWQLKMSLSTTGENAYIGDYNHDAGAGSTWVESVIDLSSYDGENLSKITIYPAAGEAIVIYYDNIFIESNSSNTSQTSIYEDAVSSGTIWHSNGAEIANPLSNSDNSSSIVIASNGAGGWEETQIFPDTYTISTGDKLYISFYNPNGASGWQLKMSLSTTGENAYIGDYNHDAGAGSTWAESVIDLSSYVGEDLSKITIYPAAGEAKSVNYDNIYIQPTTATSSSELFTETAAAGLWHSDGNTIGNPIADAINYSSTSIINNGTSGWRDTQWFPGYTIQASDRFYISFYNPNSASQWQLRMDLSTTGAFTQINGQDYNHHSSAVSGWVEVSVDLSAYNGEEITKIQLYSSAGEAKSIYFDNVYFNTASQQSNNWLGTSSTDWSTVGNWEGSFVPMSLSNVTINTGSNSPQISGDVSLNNLNLGADLTVNSGSLTINGDMSGNGNLTVASGASLLTMDGKTTNEVTIKQNTRYADGKYSFVGSPVAQKSSITGADLGSTTYTYDETKAYNAQGGDRWVDASSTELKPGIGYAQAFQNELVFEGFPNDGSITVSGLSYTAGTTNEQGWNLLSNPYPAAIDVTKFLAANTSNIDNAVYLWDDGGSENGAASNADYLSVNTIGSTSGNNGGSFNGYISSMQGFFVKLSSVGTSSVVFNEDMRATGNNADANFFRKDVEQPTTIKLVLKSSDGSYNELLIGLLEDATVGVDKQYDASKFISHSNLQFYSYINDSKYTIQGLPFLEGVSTTLGYDLGKASDLEISIQEMTGVENGMAFFLTDKVTNEVYDLNKTSSLNFSSVAGSDQNRFVLTYGVSSAILSTSLEIKKPMYRFQEGVLTVSFAEELSIMGYSVYDLSGKRLTENQEKQSLSELNLTIPHTGINIVKIVTEKGTFTKKFIFK